MKNLILIDEYIPLGDTRYAFRISKYIILMKNNTVIVNNVNMHYGICSHYLLLYYVSCSRIMLAALALC